MQTKEGSKPNGFIAEEFQEWVPLVAVPRCQHVAGMLFTNSNTASQANRYKQLCQDIEWPTTCKEPAFLLAIDQDRRHSFNDFTRWRADKANTGHAQLQHRLLYKWCEGRWIQLKIQQLLPSAESVPDAMQMPVELVVGLTKRAANDLIVNIEKASGSELCDALLQGGQSVTREIVHSCWQHAEKAILVFAAEKGEEVRVELSRGPHKGVHTFRGTHGGRVPKLLRG